MTDQTLTKEQILEHALGVNLFLARNGDLVRIDAYDKLENIDYPLAVLNFTNEDSDRYFVADNGRFYTGKESPKDIVSLVTADNLKQLFSQPQHSAPAPKPDIDFEQCIKDSTFLKTRDGSKVLLTRRNDTPNTTYPYAGVVIRASGFVTNAFWMVLGKFNYGENELDIVGLWDEPKQPAIDLEKCFKDGTPLKTRDGHMVILDDYNAFSLHYPFAGQVYDGKELVSHESWACNGKLFKDSDRPNDLDIVGLWEE
ncbi:hypothetical protein ACFGX7_03480 [Pasteurella multocida]